MSLALLIRRSATLVWVLAALVAFRAATVIAAAAEMASAPVAVSFADKEQVPLAATTLEVRNADTSPTSYPYVTNRSPVTYDQAVRAWAAQRFNLTGGTPDVVRVTLRTGSIVEKLLPVHTGISGWFHKDQSAEYTGTLDILIEIVDANGQVVGTVDGKSWESQTVREDASSTDRENAWLSVVKITFDNLDKEMIPRMRQSLSSFVRP
jgi:hypothetical protein